MTSKRGFVKTKAKEDLRKRRRGFDRKGERGFDGKEER